MRKILLLPLIVVSFYSCKKNKDISQEPIPNNKALVWAKTFGGSEYDFASSIVQLPNGEFIVAGNTRSTNGDITGGRVGYDAWLFKVDNGGNKVWSHTYGANDDEYSTGVVSSSEGGFLIAGYTFLNYHNTAWVIKTDANGNELWQKNLSQSTDAKPLSIISTNDGAFLVAGYTSTSANRDGWIAKIDGNGGQIWSKTFGGSGEDQLTSIVKASDGGYTLTGYTNSRDGDIASSKGNYDGWILKIDASGNKVWSDNFGGSDEDYLKGLIQTSDGGFIVAGYTRSTNGDIPQNRGGNEEWLIKLDGSGNKVWTKTFGGLNEEYITAIVGTADGGFITAGYSNSTTYDVTRANNNFSAWLLKMDGSGNKVSGSTYGHSFGYDDFTNTLIATQDGGYMIGGYSFVENRGYDGWLVKIDNF